MLHSVKRVVVVGGGPGGLVFANVIADAFNSLRKKEDWSVTVVNCVKNGKDGGKRQNRGLGLWPNSQRVLEALDAWDCLNPFYIPPAAYRDKRGKWLSKASTSSKLRVGSVMEDRLLSVLEERATQRGVNVLNDFRVTSAVHESSPSADGENNGGVVVLSNGTESSSLTADLLVGADGSDSFVRESFFAQQLPPVQSNGFTCASFVLHTDKWCDETYPFETLGCASFSNSAPSRFACIPHGGGHFCFGTFPAVKQPGSAGENGDDFFFDHMRAVFEGYHDPVPGMIEYAREEQLQLQIEHPLHYCEASPSSLLSPGCESLSAPAFLIGDAWHCIGPNLAQGSSVAIEDAWELGYALRSQETVSGVRNDFFKKRRRRVQKYRRFSEFTEFLSGMSGNGFFARNGRDAMQFVPDPLNSTIFDFSLNESLGGKGYGMSGIS
eukprot:g1979.t1